MSYGLPCSDAFLDQLNDEEFRQEFVRDHMRVRLATLMRSLRERKGWSQRELGTKMGTSQSAVSRIEDPDYGKLTLQTLFDAAEAFDLPLMVDFARWEDWLQRIDDRDFERNSFDEFYNGVKTALNTKTLDLISICLKEVKEDAAPAKEAFQDIGRMIELDMRPKVLAS